MMIAMRYLAGAASLCLAAIITPAFAAALDVAPTRIFIEDNQRSATLTVINRSDRSTTFRVNVADVLTEEDGSSTMLETAGDEPHNAARMIRFSPRQATLGPGERQTVRIMVRRPAGIEAGESRARIAVMSLPAPEPDGQISGTEEGDLAVRIEALFGVTLPIAITHGQPQARVAFDSVEQNNQELQVALLREGQRSVYGRLDIHAGDSPEGELLLTRNRAVVAYPLERRVVAFEPLPAGSQIHLVYLAFADDGGHIKASKTVTLR